MKEDTIESFFADSTSYIESLVNCRERLKDSTQLLSKLDDVIFLELELALLGAEKAKSEVIKKSSSPDIRLSRGALAVSTFIGSPIAFNISRGQ